MKSEIRHSWFYQHPPQAVWEYLTHADLISQWLMETDFKPIPGYHFQFKTRPLPNFDFNGIVDCVVLELDPPKKLVYSWKGGPGNGIITMDTTVEWTLQQRDNGTELRLLHSGFKDQKAAIFPLMDQGWKKNMETIDKLLKTASGDSIEL